VRETLPTTTHARRCRAVSAGRIPFGYLLRAFSNFPYKEVIPHAEFAYLAAHALVRGRDVVENIGQTPAHTYLITDPRDNPPLPVEDAHLLGFVLNLCAVGDFSYLESIKIRSLVQR
jgi:hypothetical protein